MKLHKASGLNCQKALFGQLQLLGFSAVFRFGELLAKSEITFNPFESLLWSDIKFFEDQSVQIKNKIPKNRTPCVEFVFLVSFPGHGCCPIEAISTLAVLSGSKE